MTQLKTTRHLRKETGRSILNQNKEKKSTHAAFQKILKVIIKSITRCVIKRGSNSKV